MNADSLHMRVTRIICALAVAAALQAPTLSVAAPIDIVHGSEVTPTEYATTWPFIVALTVPGATGHGAQFCGGSLLNSTTVVTAAHCVVGSQGIDSGLSVQIVAGLRDLNTPGGDTVPVETVDVHPSYIEAESGNDVAVLKLARPTTVAASIQLIDASADNLFWNGIDDDPDDGPESTDVALIAGWGNVDQGVRPPDGQLRAATVDAQTDTDCGDTGVGGHGYSTFDASTMLCAGTIAPPDTTDTCQGDSGGPLIVDIDPTGAVQWRLVGLTSWGGVCGGDQWGVFSRVAALRGFIDGAHPSKISNPTLSNAGSTVAPGTQLSCSLGSFNPVPASNYIVWQRVTGANASVLGNGSTYTTQPSDANTTIRCAHEAVDNSWTGVAMSATVAVGDNPPATGGGSGTGTIPPPDTQPPTQGAISRRCTKRTCTLRLPVTDSSGIRSVTAVHTRTYKKRCKRRMCKATTRRTVAAKRGSGDQWSVTIPRSSGNHSLRIVSTDNAGIKAKAKTVSFRL